MAYTILKSDGTLLTSIPDGTINTTSTSLGLPGRNYAGYGEALDENFVWLAENFASSTLPANALEGQLWYDTGSSTLKICPATDQANSLAWASLTSSTSGGNTTFGTVTVTGNLSANNMVATNNSNAAAMTTALLTVTANATIADANIVTANIGTLYTTAITTGSQLTPGIQTGVWTQDGDGTANGVGGTSMWVTGGNLVISGGNLGIAGIKSEYYYFANGDPLSFAGTYNNSNVAAYLPTYNGNILTVQTQATTLTTGANTTAGTMTGNWTLSSGSRLAATYADLAERFSADDFYSPGTVVELGGDAEITAVKYELSEDVFGVVSDNMAFLMNNGAGSQETHPAIAMTGRVRVNTFGAVRKGQRLVSAGEGQARAAEEGEATAFNVIGRALENKTTTDFGTVEAIVTIK